MAPQPLWATSYVLGHHLPTVRRMERESARRARLILSEKRGRWGLPAPPFPCLICGKMLRQNEDTSWPEYCSKSCRKHRWGALEPPELDVPLWEIVQDLDRAERP